MEKEEQELEQETETEEQDAEETAPLVRRSRNGDERKIFEIPDVDGEASNGVSMSNGGHAIQSENGAQSDGLKSPSAEEQKMKGIESEAINGEHKKIEESDWVLENTQESINGDHEIEKTGGVLENGPEAMNGETNSENLVFHDKFEGVNPTPTVIWKTQIFDAPANTKSDDSDLSIQFNGTSVLNNQYEEESEENSVSSSSIQSSDTSSQEGVKSTPTYIITETILKGPARYDAPSVDFATQFNGTSAVNNQYEEEIEENGHSSPNVHPPSQGGGTSYEPSKEIESAETDLVNEDDLEITASDVERVIKNQTTHDLYCPNCKSCITKRVILSKRKRGIRIPDEGIKRPKPETVSLEEQVIEEGEVGNFDAQLPLIDEDERDRGPHIFRCLSCFSIFIPTGDGFKLFRLFGDKSGKETVKDEQTPNVKKNWFSNMFKPNRQETVFEQASYSAIPSSDPARGEPSVLTFPDLKPSENEILTNGGKGKLDIKAKETVDATKFDVSNTDQRMESKSGPGELQTNRERVLPSTPPMMTQVTYMENAEDGISFPEKDGLKSLNNSNKEFPNLQNSDEGIKTNQIVQPRGADKDDVHLSPPSVSTVEASDVEGMLSISVLIPHEEQDVKATIVTTSLLENKNTDSRSSDNGEIYPAEVQQQLVTTQTFDFHHDEPLRTGISSAVVDAPAGQGNDTRITIETHPPETQVNAVDGERNGERQERNIEVIKSIVFGGLAESMTSLSVVASAAGGGAATLSVLAMGAANLIGGLFVISHNLWDLKCDRVEEQMSNQVTEQADRYKQLLGRRQNFVLHAFIAIVSYLVFGLVSPVVYGFSFRETDDKQLKLVVVAAASLFCIVMLAVGKAYVQRPSKPYLKTVITFLTLGIMISGVSYATGGLVERLLEQFGVFDGSSTAAPNLMRPVGSEWASY